MDPAVYFCKKWPLDSNFWGIYRKDNWFWTTELTFLFFYTLVSWERLTHKQRLSIFSGLRYRDALNSQNTCQGCLR